MADKDLEIGLREVATGGLVCAQCGADHSELVKLLAEMERNWVPTWEWLRNREALLLEMAEQRRRGEAEGEYWGYLQHRLAVVERELRRRKELERWGGPRIPDKASVSREALEEVKRRADLVRVLSRYVEVLPGQRFPRRYRCPAHGDGVDRDPSGVIYGDGHYWCFGCNAGGDVLTAIQAFGGLSFREALEALAGETGVAIPEASRHAGGSGRRAAVGVKL